MMNNRDRVKIPTSEFISLEKVNIVAGDMGESPEVSECTSMATSFEIVNASTQPANTDTDTMSERILDFGEELPGLRIDTPAYKPEQFFMPKS